MPKDVIVKDKGLDQIVKNLEFLKSRELVVGVQGARASAPKRTRKGNTSITLVEVATIHEFGAPKANIPQRSFMRSTATESRPTLVKFLESAVAVAVNPKSNQQTIKREIRRAGVFLQARIRNKIVDIKTPPLAPATIRRKARTIKGIKGVPRAQRVAEFAAAGGNPLVDTGQLKSSITFTVRRVTPKQFSRAERPT